jgi:hypothetical protein
LIAENRDVPPLLANRHSLYKGRFRQTFVCRFILSALSQNRGCCCCPILNCRIRR